MGEISINGTIIKLDELASEKQVCLDFSTKKVLLPITSAGDFGAVSAELIGCFNLFFFNSAEDAVYKALGVGVKLLFLEGVREGIAYAS